MCHSSERRHSLTPETDIAWRFLLFSRFIIILMIGLSSFLKKRKRGEEKNILLSSSFPSLPLLIFLAYNIGDLQFSGRNFSCKCLQDDSHLR